MSGVRPLVLSLLAAPLLVGGWAAPAAAQVPPAPGPDVVVAGSGWGHSVGMSQYGARALAQAGRSAAQVLQHYYPGTAVGPDPRVPNDREVRVDVFRARPQAGSTRVDLRALGANDPALPPTSPVTLDLNDGAGPRQLPTDAEGWWVSHDVTARQYVLHRGTGEVARGPDAQPVRVQAAPAGANPGVIKVLNLGGGYAGAYQWGVLTIAGAAARNGALEPVLVLPLQNYLWGLAEVPSSWEPAVLQAQAITGRTYLARVDRVVSATPSDQAYAGWDKERTGNAGWVAAVNATSGVAVTYRGELAETYYSSSHGLGRSESSAASWAYGSGRDYLRSVEDPWSLADGTGNPYRSWTARATNEGFGGVVGLAKVNSVRIVSRSEGGSPLEVDVDGWRSDGVRTTVRWKGAYSASDARGAGSRLRLALPLTEGGAGGRLRSQQISALTLAPFTDDEESVHQFNIGAVAATGVAQGCTSSTFCPKGAVTRGQMAAFLVRALRLPPYAGPDLFRDIATSPQRDEINRLAAAQKVGGFPDGTYRPFAPVTREQMATFLARAFDVPTTTGPDRFTDIAASVHRSRINDVAARGLTGGCTATTYCPGGTVTREQMASFLARATGVGA
jgi:peptidoglycan hydrolase-like amidase